MEGNETDEEDIISGASAVHSLFVVLSILHLVYSADPNLNNF